MADCFTINDYWDKFLRVLRYGINIFVPRYKITKHSASFRSYPKSVRKLITHKHNCWKTDKLYARYKCAAKKCTKAVNDHINTIENQLISDGRLGNFYKYVNK